MPFINVIAHIAFVFMHPLAARPNFPVSPSALCSHCGSPGQTHARNPAQFILVSYCQKCVANIHQASFYVPFVPFCKQWLSSWALSIEVDFTQCRQNTNSHSPKHLPMNFLDSGLCKQQIVCDSIFSEQPRHLLVAWLFRLLVSGSLISHLRWLWISGAVQPLAEATMMWCWKISNFFHDWYSILILFSIQVYKPVYHSVTEKWNCMHVTHGQNILTLCWCIYYF